MNQAELSRHYNIRSSEDDGDGTDNDDDNKRALL